MIEFFIYRFSQINWKSTCIGLCLMGEKSWKQIEPQKERKKELISNKICKSNHKKGTTNIFSHLSVTVNYFS